MVLSNVESLLEKKKSFREDDRHTVFLMSPISSYCYDLTKIISAERVVMQ